MSKRTNSSGHHRWLWISLLAIVCIAATELAASSHYAPAFYERVTRPVKTVCTKTAAATTAFLKETAQEASVFLASLAEPDEPAIQVQQLTKEPLELPDRTTAAPVITALEPAGGREYLTGGTRIVEYFQQSAPAWAEKPYGADDIGNYGCGPAAMAMVVSSMTETRMDPAEMAQWAVKHGHWARHGGSYLSLIEDASVSFGLSCTPITERTPEAIENVLFADGLVVALMGPGHFTEGGHFIVIRGVTLSGTLLVADPNSPDRSLMEWEPQLILDELSSNTNSGGPLWGITLPPD